MDRISSLPEPLLQHIMSFLPFKQVVQTSLVSKVWRQAWLTFPVLEFDEHSESYKFPVIKHLLKRILEIRKDWYQILQIRHRNMVGVRKMTLNTGDSELADRCASYAIENNVKELILKIDQSLLMWYTLPSFVLCSKSIDVLQLEGCKLELPRRELKLSLRRLCLSQVYADDQVINNVLLRCSLIEHLELSHCAGFKSLELFGLAKLSEITLGHNDELKRLKIDALNANSSLCISGTVPSELDICNNMTSLSLAGIGSFTDEWLCSYISRIPLLERLYITQFYNIERMKISSCRLKTLGISICRKLVEVGIETPNLSTFSYVGDLISFSSSATLNLSETNLCFTPYTASFRRKDFDDIEPEWYEKYIELIAKFRQFSTVVNLESGYWEYLHFPGELRQNLTPPLSGVKHLNFRTRSLKLNYELAKVIDFLLWISPHAETIYLDYSDHKLRFQFWYKERPHLYEGEIARCCKSVPVVSCWEHCIKKVDIEITSRYTELYLATGEMRRSTKVKRCVVEGERILEKIDGVVESGVSNFTLHEGPFRQPETIE